MNTAASKLSVSNENYYTVTIMKTLSLTVQCERNLRPNHFIILKYGIRTDPKLSTHTIFILIDAGQYFGVK